MKMTKKALLPLIRDVLSGMSGSDSMIVRPLKQRGYEVYTGSGIGYYDHGKDEFVLRHDRNESSLADAREILEDHERMLWVQHRIVK